MIRTVLFVHGTGVRKAAYEYTASRVAAGLTRVAPDVKFEPCLWGDVHGAQLGLHGASIPEFSLDETTSPTEEQDIALWELLAKDPLFELRELSATTSRSLEPPSEKQLKIGLVLALGELGLDFDVCAMLDDRALKVQWQAAVSFVENSSALKEAIAATPKVDTTLRLGIARAVVAALQQQLLDANIPALPVSLRDQLVELCINRLGMRDAGVIKDWVKSKLVGLGLRLAMAKANRERDALFSSAAPTAGDVVLYQARGADIRGFIQQRVEACGGDVAIVAHSLGGIACVDLLIERSMPQVKLLVTAGSQAPFMYEINALSSLEFGNDLPAHFPARWLNFYDCNDLLSYTASKVFTGRAEDIEIKSSQPFPQSHSAYWDAPALWEILGLALKQ